METSSYTGVYKPNLWGGTILVGGFSTGPSFRASPMATAGRIGWRLSFLRNNQPSIVWWLIKTIEHQYKTKKWLHLGMVHDCFFNNKKHVQKQWFPSHISRLNHLEVHSYLFCRWNISIAAGSKPLHHTIRQVIPTTCPWLIIVSHLWQTANPLK